MVQYPRAPPGVEEQHSISIENCNRQEMLAGPSDLCNHFCMFDWNGVHMKLVGSTIGSWLHG